jgi:hypothetical protein
LLRLARRRLFRRLTLRRRHRQRNAIRFRHVPRQRRHPRSDVRLRRDLRHQLLDLPLRPVPRPRQEPDMIFLAQMRRQHRQRGQVDLAPRDHLEDDRKAPRRPRRRDPLPRRAL